MAQKGELIFEGREKKIFTCGEDDKVIISFKDDTSAFGGVKLAVLKDKGICNNKISAIVFKALASEGIPTHFIETISDREQLCRKAEMIPLQMIVRNRLAGSTAKLLGVEEGRTIPNTVFEIRYNDDGLHDPMINDHHAVALGLCDYGTLGYLYELARNANDVLIGLFARAGMDLVDFKMEFGRDCEGNIMISDEISPDNSRIWDSATGRKLDKDRFRHDMSDVCASYREVLERLEKIADL